MTTAAVENGLTIGQVARRTGQTVVALRHWESIGLLPPPPRAGGKRRYPEDVLARVEMVVLLRRAGFRLDEARELLGDRPAGRPPGERWRGLIARKDAELEERLRIIRAARGLLAHLEACRCTTLGECLAEANRTLRG